MEPAEGATQSTPPGKSGNDKGSGGTLTEAEFEEIKKAAEQKTKTASAKGKKKKAKKGRLEF